MAEIKTADVVKLRKTTGAGMMDCKNALKEAEGDFDKATEIIRKKGKAIANKRADKEATEGVVLAKSTADLKSGVVLLLSCETDFVAINADFIAFATSILDLALEKQAISIEALKALDFGGKTVEEAVSEQMGKIGEKVEISFFQHLSAEETTAYVHPGNKLVSLVGFSKTLEDKQVGRDVAMQVAAMNPVAVDKDQVSQEIIDKEIEIGKEQARQTGKPEEILEKIAHGKLNKYFKENTLLNQDFIKDNKTSVGQYISSCDKDLKVTGFVRYALKD